MPAIRICGNGKGLSGLQGRSREGAVRWRGEENTVQHAAQCTGRIGGGESHQWIDLTRS